MLSSQIGLHLQI